MDNTYNIAILGATGKVGQELLRTLEERQFPINHLKLLASGKSVAKSIMFKNTAYPVEEVTTNSFKNIDIVLASAGEDIAKKYAQAAVHSGACVIDNSNAFRMAEGIPLVVPEVNGYMLQHHQGIIANPNCSTAQLVPVLQILHELGCLKRVIVSTYQSVSGAGKEAMEELETQIMEWQKQTPITTKVLPKQIAFNVIPHIDKFLENGYTKEEMKVINETRKILNLPNLAITCTAVRVPVMIGHSEAITVDLEKKITLKAVRYALANSSIIEVVDDHENQKYSTPIDAALKDPIYVSRIREDTSSAFGLNLWVVADNLRIGAALNAVKIAEYLTTNDLLQPQSLKV